EFLEKSGIPTVRLFEPTQGYWGRKIRKLLVEGRGDTSPEEELSWFIQDRREDVEKNIRPALAQNKVVVIDRYYYSTAAYQGALGFDPQKICRDNEAFAPVPDRVFLFVAPPERCLKRIEGSRDGHSAFEKLEYLKKVQAIYDSFSGPQVRRIDTDRSKEDVHAQLIRELADLLPLQVRS
nr:dTMP kinase [Nitrospinaceae bacterium]